MDSQQVPGYNENDNKIEGGFGSIGSIGSIFKGSTAPAPSDTAPAPASAPSDTATASPSRISNAMQAVRNSGFGRGELLKSTGTSIADAVGLTNKMTQENLNKHKEVIDSYTKPGSLLINAHLENKDSQIQVVLESFSNKEQEKLLDITANGLNPSSGSTSEIKQNKSMPLQALLGEKRGIKIVTGTGEVAAADEVADEAAEAAEAAAAEAAAAEAAAEAAAAEAAAAKAKKNDGGRTRRRRRRNKKMSSRRRRASRRR